MFHPQGLRAPAIIPPPSFPAMSSACQKGIWIANWLARNIIASGARRFSGLIPERDCDTPVRSGKPGIADRYRPPISTKIVARKDASPRSPGSLGQCPARPGSTGLAGSARCGIRQARPSAVGHGFCRLKGKEVQTHRNGGAAEPWKSSLLLEWKMSSTMYVLRLTRPTCPPITT